jgi:hypothetical protein
MPVPDADENRLITIGDAAAVTARRHKMESLLWTVITILFVLWLLGLVTSIGGPLIHLVLVVAVILLIYNLVTRGRATL